MDAPRLLSKFRGSTLAALAGDCIGGEYEAAWAPVPLGKLIKMDSELKESFKTGSQQMLRYTDDTEMAHVLAQSFLTDKSFNAGNIASRFSATFSNSVGRGYGVNVREVFYKLQGDKYAKDPYLAAKEQFGGEGSYGNGSAMRVFPVALFHHKQPDKLKKAASSSARITHSHVDAVNGAVLLAVAVETALSCGESLLSWEKFWKVLKSVADDMERGLPAKPYTHRLDHMFRYLTNDDAPTVDDVNDKIGTGIKATEAVSAAIFSFLLCLAERQPAGLASLTKVQQTIFYALTLGGDTDTVATMTGAIAGAMYGVESVPDHWVSACEGKDLAMKIATDLHAAVARRLS